MPTRSPRPALVHDHGQRTREEYQDPVEVNLGRAIVVWVARHILALLMIILILVAARVAVPSASAWLQDQVRVARAAPTQRSTLIEVRQRFNRYAASRATEAEMRGQELRRAPDLLLRQRRASIDNALSREEEAMLTNARLLLATAAGNSDAILAHYRASAEVSLLRREMRLIDALLAARGAERQQATIMQQRMQAVQELNASRIRWQSARDKVQVIERRPLAFARNFACENVRLGIGCQNYRALKAARAEKRAAEERYVVAQRRIMAIDRTLRGVRVGQVAAVEATSLIEQHSAQIQARLERVEQVSRANWVVWIGGPILEVLPTALAILAAAILAPMLVKGLLYFMIAPVAARQPALQLGIPDQGHVEDISIGSAVSQAIHLQPQQELLLVPEALQSTPQRAEKRTKWLLSWSMPLSSIASGMVALVRIRAQRPETVVISATDNGFAEIALIGLVEGSSIVLRPRALRGLMQPIGRPVEITRHWRIGHVSAWLTWQFRFLVFHGPCTLIVEGTRGVRLERAGASRGVNRAATLGFSAGLAYSVTRSEAFGAYLLGKQELFNDSFAGAGHYLYEEVPRAGCRGSLWGRGLRGLGDAALKIFGL